MAASDRRTSGFNDSLSGGREVAVCCEPCNYVGQFVEAAGFCVNCQENFCEACLDVHKRTRATRHHNMLDTTHEQSSQTSNDKIESKMCIEYCKIHLKEVIKFFCPSHNEVGCNDCITLNHRICDIDYIPDKCAGTGNSTEFTETLRNVAAAITESEILLKKALSLKEENKANVEEVIQDIEKFQKQLNDKLEQLKRNIVKEANLHKARRDTYVAAASDYFVKISAELKQLLSVLHYNREKRLDAQAFVTMKHAQLVLNSSNTQKYENQLTRNRTNVVFEANKEVDYILSHPNGIGKLSLRDYNDQSKTTISDTTATVTIRDVKSVMHKNDIHVRTKRDKHVCVITGCAVVSAEELLLVDWANCKIKVVNIDTESVLEEMILDSPPFDVTVLPKDQAAVTSPGEEKILILRTAGKLKKIRSIQISRNCWGIAYHQDHQYVVCQEPNSLLVMDMQGNVQRDIPLQTALDHTFGIPLFIAVSKNGRKLYISDWKAKIMASLTLQGEITAVYKAQKLKEPRGFVELEDGSLLVCCGKSGTIHYVSPDMKHGHTVTKDVPKAESICNRPGNEEIYVNGNQCDQIKVFTLY